jgi:hypothetical protein
VVPPPDKRFTQPGGFNFPQGSIIHRKAIDPTSDDYRTGTTAIARAARPRSMISGDGHTLIAKTEQEKKPAAIEAPSEASSEVIQASAAEASTESTLAESDAGHVQTTISSEKPSPEFSSASAPADVQLEAATASPTLATMRIVGDDEAASDAAGDGESDPTDAKSPFTTVAKPPTSLTVAPPTASSTAPAEPAIAATAEDARGDAAGRTRFYFDRKHELHPSAKAQPVAYLGNAANGVAFADGAAGNGGVDGGPEGASAYSYHNKYQWLRGKLEYSSAAKRWKLRYIPIDGTTDQFGGSVVLPPSPLLEKMHAGEMVTAIGAIGEVPAEHGRFAPLYQLSAIHRQ